MLTAALRTDSFMASDIPLVFVRLSTLISGAATYKSIRGCKDRLGRCTMFALRCSSLSDKYLPVNLFRKPPGKKRPQYNCRSTAVPVASGTGIRTDSKSQENWINAHSVSVRSTAPRCDSLERTNTAHSSVRSICSS